ncbi:MAG: DUF2520 domain-containing protein [Acidimicrobiia bacterium]|nr:DUF2520 domain-containing protein [Acidimicrobiia bacterium]
MTGGVAIVGAGQAGAAIGHGLVRAGYSVVAVASRSAASAATLAATLHATPLSPEAAAAAATTVFVTPPDDVISRVVAEIAPCVGPGQEVVHCSGVLGLDVLDPARARGAAVGILHPVTPLVPPDDPATLYAKPMGIETHGSDAWLRLLVQDLGGRAVSLRGVDRTLYHAGAVMSANLVVALSSAAERVLAAGGVKEADAHMIVESLLSATVRNVTRSGAAGALTGPVRRGDATVVRRHRVALAAIDPELAETYRLVSRRILDLMPLGEARAAADAALEVSDGGGAP